MRLLLITGIPGSGKTTIGNHLADSFGFRHLDFEEQATLMVFTQSDANLRRQINALKRGGRDVVVSWGFVPSSQLAQVLLMRDLGFEWIWFDGNREAARRTFVERGTVPEHLLDIQMGEISRHIPLDQLQPRIVNTFDSDGDFRSLDDIAAELLAATS